MRRFAAVVALGLTVMATPALAQGSYGRMGGSGRGGMHRAGGSSMSPELMTGPPAPAEMTKLASLDASKAASYATLYQNFMDSSVADRDSLKAMMQQRGQGMAAPAGARSGLVKDLGQQQKSFDSTLKGLLTKDQWKAYQGWLKQSQKSAPHRRAWPAASPGAGQTN